MGLILICVVVIIIAQFYRYYFENEYDIGSNLITILSGIILVFLLSIAGIVIIIDKTELTDYKIEMNYFNSLKNNKMLTDVERGKAIKRIIKINKNIEGTKIWKDNFWIGIFFPPTTATLKLIDINIIPPAIYSIKLNKGKYNGI